MPLFSKKSDKNVIPQRKERNPDVPMLQEEIDDFQNINLKLGSKEFKFIDGTWIVTSGSSSKENLDDYSKLRHKVNRLEKENNLNKIKVEILLDMISENMCMERDKHMK